jgi:hypothetical protein
MCELLAMVSRRPFAVLDVVPLAAGVERWGIAGMSWGAAWVDAASGALRHYKRDVALRDDERAQEALRDATTTTLFIHLRRPSLLSTLSMADAQPFASDEPPFVFAHNGDFKCHEEYRPRYDGLLRGRADTEVGFRRLVDLRREHGPVEALLRLQDDLQGNNNLLYLDGDGRLYVYATGEENAIYRFRQGDRHGIVTSLYSADRAVFDLVMPDAEYLGDVPIGYPELLAVGEPLPAAG